MQVKNTGRCFMCRWGNGTMSKMQNVSAQRYSIMSNLKIETENSLPQRYSKMSNLGLGALSPSNAQRRVMSTVRIKNRGRCFMNRWKNESMSKKQTSPAQRYSEMSNLENCPSCPYCPLDLRATPPQLDSGMSSLLLHLELSVDRKARIVIFSFDHLNKNAIFCWSNPGDEYE
jgi:hypothetical protein